MYVGVYLLKYESDVLFVLLLIEIHQNCASQALILPVYSYFKKSVAWLPNQSGGAHFKACIFQTVGPIFMKIFTKHHGL